MGLAMQDAIRCFADTTPEKGSRPWPSHRTLPPAEDVGRWSHSIPDASFGAHTTALVPITAPVTVFTTVLMSLPSRLTFRSGDLRQSEVQHLHLPPWREHQVALA